MELVFKLEYWPVKMETFNIKVEKQKNKVCCDLFTYSLFQSQKNLLDII